MHNVGGVSRETKNSSSSKRQSSESYGKETDTGDQHIKMDSLDKDEL